MLFQYDELLLDSDLNDFGAIIQNQMQRLAQKVLGDVAVGDAWSIKSSGGNNNFTINGGSGALDGTGRCWVGGLPCLLMADKDFSDVLVTEPNIHACSTILAAYTLTDTSSQYSVNALVDRYLTPDITDTSDAGNPAKFKIISNTATTITTDPADGSMLTVGTTGDRYRIELSTYDTNNGEAALVIDAGHSPVVIGSTEIYTSDAGVQAKANDYYEFMLLRYTKAAVTYTHRITASDTGTGRIAFEPPTTVTLTSGVETFDIIDVRYDTVYLDTYLDEIDADEDGDLWHDEAGTNIEGARRLQVIQKTFVDEGDARTRLLPETYIDADGNSHYTTILANFKREYAQTTIPDTHILSPIGGTYSNDAGGGDEGSGSSGGGLEEDADLASIVAEVVAARLGKTDLKTMLTDTLFEDDGDVALKLEELSDTGANLKMTGADVIEAAKIKLGGAGATIEEIETALSSSDVKIPTSKAIETYIAGLMGGPIVHGSGVAFNGVIIPEINNLYRTTLVGDITNAVTTIVLADISGISAETIANGGVITFINSGPDVGNTSYIGATGGVTEFSDGDYGFFPDTTPFTVSEHEQITFTSITPGAGVTGILVGVVRGANGTTNVSHKSGDLIFNGAVAFIVSLAMIQDYVDIGHDRYNYTFVFLKGNGAIQCYMKANSGHILTEGLASFLVTGKSNP